MKRALVPITIALAALAVGLGLGALTGATSDPVTAQTANAASTPSATSGTAAAPAACGAVWGIGARQAGPARPVSTKVTGVGVSEQACFDRLVIDLGPGRRPGYRIGYVSKIRVGPSGKSLSLRGKAFLLITIRAPAGARYHAYSASLAKVAGLGVFRQVAGAGSVGSVTSIGLGVSTKLPFRVTMASGPGADSRLMIDVAR